MAIEILKEVDVLVVGMGPGGSGAAKTAAELGLNVLGVEKRAEIGAPKRCGEAISRTGMTERIGIEPKGPWIIQDINGAIVYAPNGEKIVIDYGDTEGWVVERKMFDKHLAALAAKAGARIIARTEARSFRRDNGGIVASLVSDGKELEVRAKIVIAADGVESRVARSFGINTSNKLSDICAGAQYEMAGVETQDKMLEFFFGNDIAPGGYCVTPDTEIVTRNTVKPITDVVIGEDVYSLKGWKPATGATVRKYKGDIIAITPSMLNNETKLTPDHLVRVWNKKDGFSWKRADKLTKGIKGKHRNGDYLLFPVPKEKGKTHIITEEYYNGIKHDGKIYPIGRNQFGAIFKYKYGIPNKLRLTKELMDFFGFFVAEGNINSNGIILSTTDETLAEYYKKIGEKTFGVNASIWKSKKQQNKKQCIQIQFPSKILRKLFKEMFKEGCHNKTFPRFFCGLGESLKLSFLKGLYLGDGNKYKKLSTGYEHLNYTSVSKSLIYDLWMLLSTIGIAGSIGKIRKKDAYRLRIYGKQLQKLRYIFGGFAGGKMINNKSFIRNGFVHMGIRKLYTQKYDGAVYDIQSNGSFCPNFIVHNCWIFPKGEGIANVGIGVRRPWAKRPAVEYLDDFISKRPELKNASILEVNSGGVPVGGFLETNVADNFLVVGDAAHHVNPIHGGGIPEAYMGGRIAARVAAEAIKADDLSAKFLQRYDKEWMKERGSKLEKLVKVRQVMESMENDDLNWLAQYLSGEEIVDISKSEGLVRLGKILMKKPKMIKFARKLL